MSVSSSHIGGRMADLSKMTDEEFLAYMKKQGSESDKKYRQEQLNKENSRKGSTTVGGYSSQKPEIKKTADTNKLNFNYDFKSPQEYVNWSHDTEAVKAYQNSVSSPSSRFEPFNTFIPQTTGRSAGTYTKTDPLGAFGRSLDAGLASSANAIINTVESADQFLAGALTLGNVDSLLGPTGLYDLYDDIESQKQQKVQKDIEDKSINPYVSQFVQMLPDLGLQTALAAMTGGTSAAAQLGNPTIAQAARTQIQNITKNPTFWKSISSTFGNSYQEAKESGADNTHALQTALLNSVPNAMIEMSGGIEAVIDKMLKGKGTISSILKSALEEGLEEVAQYPLDEWSKAVGYGKDGKLFSTEGDALINPVQMGQNFLMGAAGGALGGSVNAAASRFLPRPNTPTSTLGDYETAKNISTQEALPIDTMNRLENMETKRAGGVSTDRVDALLKTIHSGGTISNNSMEFLSPNKDQAARADFQEKTGVKLPSTASGTRKAIRNYQKTFLQNLDGVDNPARVIQESSEENVLEQNEPEKIETTKALPRPVRVLPRPINGVTARLQRNSGESLQPESINSTETQQERVLPRPSQGRQLYSQLLEQYGAIKHGEADKKAPERMVRQVPKQSGENQYVSQFARTAAETASMGDKQFETSFKDAVASGVFSHERWTDKKTVQSVDAIQKAGMLEGAWGAAKEKTGALDKQDIATGERLLLEKMEKGDVKGGEKVLAELCAAATATGQNLQAFRLLKRMTPTGAAYYVENLVKRLNNELVSSKKYRNSKITLEKDGQQMVKKIKNLSESEQESAKPIQLSEESLQKILNAKDSAQRDNAIDNAYLEVAKQLPIKLSERFDAWRYFSMLGNVKSHVRNMSGNVAMIPITKAKDIIAMGIEKALLRGDKRSQRTKSIAGYSKEDKALKALAMETFQDVVGGGNKWETPNGIWGKRSLLGDGKLGKIAEFNSNALEAEDTVFKKQRYKTAFASAAKARGYSAEFLQGKTAAAHKAMRDIKAYALRQAQEATFQQDSDIANMLQKLSNKNKVAHYILEGVTPFKKTPVNVVSTAFSYSPFGLAKGVYDAVIGDRSAETIDLIAKGVSGSALASLGYLLSSIGLLTGSGSDDTKERNADALEGKQRYALQVGDLSFTLDWLSPAAIPLFLGAEIHDAISSESGATTAEIAEAIGNIAAPIFDMSMMQNVSNALQNVNDPGELLFTAMETALSYFTQAVPTTFGQLARTVDPVRRSTQPEAANTNLTSNIQRVINKTIAKIPGLSMTLEPYVDPLGNQDVVKNQAGDLIWNAVEQFISPGYLSKSESSPVLKELRQVANEKGENGILPSYAETKFKVDGTPVLLTAKQATEQQTIAGTTYYSVANDLMENSIYRELDNEGKYSLLEDAKSYATAMGKEAVSDYEATSWMQKANKAAEAGISVADYIATRSLFNSEEMKNDTEKQRSWLKEQPYTAKQKNLLDELLISDVTIIPTNKEVNYSSDASFNITTEHPDTAKKIQSVLSGSVNEEMAYEVYERLQTLDGAGKGSEDKRNYIMGLDIPSYEKARLAKTFIDKEDDRDYTSQAMLEISGLHKTYQEKYAAVKGAVTAEQFLKAYKFCKNATWPKDTRGARESALRAAIRTSSKGLSAAQVETLYQQFKNMTQSKK